MARGRAEQAPSQQPVDQQHIPLLEGRAILLAEDNSLNREVATELLKKTGARVIEANDGREAVDRVAEQPVDLVLMDLQMPVMDGFEASRRIRDQHPELPILALSAAVMEEDRARARNAGMNDHLAKPIEKQVLFQLLEAWLPAQETAGPSLQPQPKPQPSPRRAPESLAELAPSSPPSIAPQSRLESTPQESSAATGSLLPARLEGFDLQDGLNRFDQDAVLYLRLLHRFRQQIEDEFASLGEQLEQQPPTTEAKRLIHTLKGLANTVGAERLAAISTEIDQRCSRDTPIRAAQLEALTQALSEARASLASLPSGAVSSHHSQSHTDSSTNSPEANQSDQHDPRASLETIDQVLQALSAGELVDEALLAEVMACMGQQFNETLALELQTHIETFDHDRAAELLKWAAAEIADPQREA